MKWIKKGRIFTASGQYEWMKSHTQVPSALTYRDRIRVYFSTRAADGMSRIAYIDLDLNNPLGILGLSKQPILDLGAPGMFDEHGMIPNHVFRHEGVVYLFYVGWSRRTSIPYSNWMGMARSDDNGITFRRCFDGPILDRTPSEVHSATGLICVPHKNYWQGWYASGTQWLMINGRWEHTYELRACQSRDLVNWTRPNRPLFPKRLPNESNTRPTVVFKSGKWHMWYCYRGTLDFRDGYDSYRIGYAWSTDLEHWTRHDELGGMDVSTEGWDSTMVAYPCVIQSDDRILMIYAGNGFGRSGFGYAQLEEEPDGL